MREFNTAGPNKADKHYTLPPLSRIDLTAVLQLIEGERYFVLHAPRQTGKTSCLLALRDYLNAKGDYRCVYVNVEAAQAYRNNINAAMRTILYELAKQINTQFKDHSVLDRLEALLQIAGGGGALNAVLAEWSAQDMKPAIVLIDEVDALVGDTLISLLRQLRAGYTDRPQHFPQTIVLCGVRDVRDYRIHSSDGEIISGGSAFNIKAESLRLGDFSHADMQTLYAQHTTATGQLFTAEALDLAWRYTNGQPWLVNALARQACLQTNGQQPKQTIDAEIMRQAKETLIMRRDTHLDQLADKLRESRVRAVIEPIMAGLETAEFNPDDVQYVIDLGLVRRPPGLEIQIANAIYQEVIPRELSSVVQDSIALPTPPIWLKSDGTLNEARLLDTFLAFWRQHGQPLLKATPYAEVACQMVLLAFLQRVVNGGGTITREYAIGTRRMDILVCYGTTRLALELKVWRKGDRDPFTRGLIQLDNYLAGLGLNSGWLVIFDQRPDQPPIEDRTSVSEAVTPAGRTVQVIRG